MKKLYFLSLMCSFTLWSQDFEWLQTPPITLATNPDLVGFVTDCDNSGNVYFIGYKQNPFQYNDTFGDLFYNKYNAGGELQYSNSITGKVSAYDISIDTSGNVILALGYVNEITIGSFSINTNNQGIQPLLVKFNSQGEMLWHYEPMINGDAANYFKAVALDANDNIFIGYDDFNNSFIEKLTPDGTSVLRITQSNVSLLSSLDTDTEGNIYAAGSCVDPNSTFGGVAVGTTFFYNTYLVKYAPNGTYQWVRFVDDITCSKPQVAVNSPDEVYFTSELFDSYQFDGIATEGPMSGMFSDFFLAKLNEQGIFQWVREVPGTGQAYHGRRQCLTTDDSGNVYFAGWFRWAINWGNDVVTETQTFASDALLLKYNNAGDLTFVKTAGGSSEDRFDSVAVNATGDLYLAGMGRGAGSFGTLTHEGDGVVSYAFLTKIAAASLATQTPISGEGLTVYPNPAIDQCYFSGNYSKMNGRIFNALGQHLKDFEVTQNSAVDVSELSKGVYFVAFENYTVKLIKE